MGGVLNYFVLFILAPVGRGAGRGFGRPPPPVRVEPEPEPEIPEVEVALEQLGLEPVVEEPAGAVGGEKVASSHSVPTTTSSQNVRSKNTPTVAMAPSTSGQPAPTPASQWSGSESQARHIQPDPVEQVIPRAPISTKPDRIKVVKRGTKGEP